MGRNVVIIVLIPFAVSCQTHHEPAPVTTAKTGKDFVLPLNPPEGSTYHYVIISETSLTAQGHGMDIDNLMKAEIAVHYQISKDSDEYVLEMGFDAFRIHSRNGHEISDADGTGKSDALNRLLRKLKRTTIFARLKPWGSDATFGGGTEAVDQFVDSNYTEADREKARAFWEQWVEKEIIWRCLDPLVWARPDTAQHGGDHWTSWTVNSEDIHFKMENDFQLQSVSEGIAGIRSHGVLKPDSAAPWVLDKKFTGHLSGTENGGCFIDLTTGMPNIMGDSVNVGGLVQIDGHATDVRFIKTVKMSGGRGK